MLKSLFLMSSVISMVGAVPNMDHLSSTTNNASEISVSYQYETNEVNSIDDLIVGNIYHYNSFISGENYFAYMEDYSPQGNEFWDVITPFYNVVIHNVEYSYDGIDDSINNVYSENVLRLAINENEAQLCYYEYILSNDNRNNYYFNTIVISNSALSIEFDFVLTDVFKEMISYSWVNVNGMVLTEYIFKSDYLGEPIIEEKEITGLYDIINNWFYDYLYDTEQLNNYSVAFMGSTITLSAYLSMVSTIACLILLTIILILFIKWLFNLFSGLLRF